MMVVEWWVPRIAIASGSVTLATILWRPLARRWKKDFDESVFDTLSRNQDQVNRVRYIVKEIIFPREVAERQRLIERLEVVEDKAVALEAMLKAHATTLAEIANLARSMENLPDAIDNLGKTMVMVQREISEMRGEMRAWDGRERRNA